MRARSTPRATSGFTLIELMVVHVIIGVLAAAAAHSINNNNSARERRALASDVARKQQK